MMARSAAAWGSSLVLLLALCAAGSALAGSPEEDRERWLLLVVLLQAQEGRFDVCPLQARPHPLSVPSLRADAILLRFRDSIANWQAVKQTQGSLEGWDDSTPTYLWYGVILDFDLRVREM